MAHDMILPQRPFANTGKTVSALGLGTVKFGRNTGVKYPGGDGFALPSDAEIDALIGLCRDLGITLLDTAPAYGAAEERLGRALAGRRDDFFLVTKTGEEFDGASSRHDFSAAHTVMSVERSLKRLKTDRLDCVLVHSTPDDLAVVRATPALATLARLKDAGKILSFGVSAYSLAGAEETLRQSDVLMIAFDGTDAETAALTARAGAAGRAVLVKKGLKSGHIDSAAAADTLRRVAGGAGVTSLVFGSITPAHIRANVAALCLQPDGSS